MSIDPNEIRQIGKYPVEHFIAEGGMAWVFKITDPDLFDAPRALKLLKPGAAVGEEFQRFTAEAKILATIQHPNLIHVYDFGQDPATGCYFYTMDFIEGKTLAELRAEWLGDSAPTEFVRDPDATQLAAEALPSAQPRHSVRDVCEYFCGILSALSRLHRHRIIHRDIKPQNIFLTTDGIAILGDLGIAKGHEDAGAGVTAAGHTPGTPLYMSPEHSLGEQVTERSDLFSVGLSMYRVLTGQTVYDHASGVDSTNSNAVLKHLWQLHGNQAEFEFHFPDEIPEELGDVIRIACHLDESERYQSAAEMSEALQEAMTQLVAAPKAGAKRRAKKRKPGGQTRSVSPALVATLIGLPLLALGGYLAWQFLGGPSASDNAEVMQAETRAIGETVDGLIVFMASIKENGPPAKMLENAREDLADARSDASAGEQDVADASYETGERMFSRAQAAYSEICEELAAGFLNAAASAGAARAQKAGKGVPPSAEQFASQGWTELAGMMTALEAAIPQVGCDRAQALQTRIELSTAIVAKSAAVEEELGKRLPEAVASALSLADEQRTDAIAIKSKQSEYKAVMELADASLDSARKANKEGDYLVALREAEHARSEFERASHVRLAAAARDSSKKVLAKIEAHRVSIGSLRRHQQSADREWNSGEYAAAAESYGSLQTKADEVLVAANESIAARDAAIQAQADAEEANVPVNLRSAGNRKLSDGKIALRIGEFETADESFREARDAFLGAIQEASEQALRAADLDDGQLEKLRAQLRKVEEEKANLQREREEQRQAALKAEAERRAALERADAEKARLEEERLAALKSAEAEKARLEKERLAALKRAEEQQAKLEEQRRREAERAAKEREAQRLAGQGDRSAEEEEAQRLAEERRRAAKAREAKRLAAEKEKEQARQRELEELRRALAEAEERKSTQVAVVAPPSPGTGNPFVQVMKEYESAFEARDIQRLNAVYSMGTLTKMTLRDLFQECGQVRVLMDIGEATITGSDSAKLVFEQQITWKKCGSRTRVPRLSGEKIAHLRRRGGDEWQIKKIDDR